MFPFLARHNRQSMIRKARRIKGLHYSIDILPLVIPTDIQNIRRNKSTFCDDLAVAFLRFRTKFLGRSQVHATALPLSSDIQFD